MVALTEMFASVDVDVFNFGNSSIFYLHQLLSFIITFFVFVVISIR